jgi:hypothetical protein
MTAHVQAKRRAQHANGGTHGDLAGDLLYGCPEIATFLGWPVRRVRHALVSGHLPASRSGAIYVGSRQKLREHFQGGGAAEG